MWIPLAALGAVVLTVGAFIGLPDWRLLAAAMVALLGGLGLVYARWVAGRGRLEQAALLVVIIPLIVMPLVVLLWSGVTWGFGLGVLVLPSVLAGLVWPRSRARWAWVASAGVALLTFGVDALLNAYPLWSRFDATQSVVLIALVYTLIAGVILLVLAELWRAYRQITSIRLRLSVTFVAVVLLVGAASSAVSVSVGLSNVRQQTLSQLQSVAALKKSAIDSFADNLLLDLDALVTEAYEIQRLRIAIINDPLSNPQDARNGLRTRFQRVIQRTKRFDELFVLNLDGIAVLSTEQKNEGLTHDYQDYFRQGLEGPYLSPVSYALTIADAPAAVGASTAAGEAALPIQIMVSVPILDTYGDLTGVLVGRVRPDRMAEIMQERSGLGETGETFLIDESYHLLTPLLHREGVQGLVRTVGAAAAVQRLSGAPQVYEGDHGDPVIGTSIWLDNLRIAIIAERNLNEVTRGARAIVLLNIGVAIGAVGLAVVASLFFSQDISRPLSSLADTAGRVAAGAYTLEAEVERQDEIGALATAFNSMTAQLRDLIGGLEARVVERTRGLETVGEVTRATISELDIERLLPRVVDLVRDRFGLYYVGLFIVDEAKEYAVLHAGTGEAGLAMLAQGWRLPIGGESMIGQCVATSVYGVKQTEGDLVVRFDNPLLPETRSELALPLRFGRQSIGAMTVQSAQEAAFDQAEIAVFQNLADQVAVAVQNARVFAEAQTALDRAQEVQRRYQGQAWEQYVRARDVTGYEQVGQDIHPLGQALLPEVQLALVEADAQRQARQAGEPALVVPLVQGDRVLGAVGLERRDGRQTWSEDEIALVEALVEQFVLAAENQRLIDQTQARAAREQLTRQIVDRVRAAENIEDILHVASEALSRQLNASKVVVRLGPEAKLTGGSQSSV
ncbi:MAG: GAF domain-containing protein [Anaerolineae bacterium]|nr:GAF domain-containing protein [Anaerolineae bacterium]